MEVAILERKVKQLPFEARQEVSDYLDLLLRKYHDVLQQKKRNIGFLEGKAKVIFHDDWSMTPEELGMV